MTNEGIVLIMRCINGQPLYWEDIRFRSDWYELWKYLTNNPNFIPNSAINSGGFVNNNLHWTYKSDQELSLTGAA